MPKPIIGILASLHHYEHGPLPYVELCGLQRDYLFAVERAGGVPIMLPVVEDPETIRKQIELVDGLVLSGGYDVNPTNYGEEPTALLEDIHPERDAYELQAIDFANALEKPLLGICRGLQILNVAYGGSLYQDISHAPGETIKHRQMAKRFEPTHTVDVIDGTLLHKIVGIPSLSTNSFHHQAIKNLAPGLVINAQARDGVIEGVEMPGSRFVMALQWHPEMMASTDPYMQALFKAFIKAVTQGKNGL